MEENLVHEKWEDCIASLRNWIDHFKDALTMEALATENELLSMYGQIKELEMKLELLFRDKRHQDTFGGISDLFEDYFKPLK